MSEALQTSTELKELFKNGRHYGTTYFVVSKEDPLWRKATLEAAMRGEDVEDAAAALRPSDKIRANVDRVYCAASNEEAGAS